MKPSEQWEALGKRLTPVECAFVDARDITPLMNDHSSDEMLEAYRAGWAEATLRAVEGARAMQNTREGRNAIFASIAREISIETLGPSGWSYQNDPVRSAEADRGDKLRGVR